MDHRHPVDTESHALAELFMSDTLGANEEDIRDLAEAIQRACEDHCRAVEERTAGTLTVLRAERSDPERIARIERERAWAKEYSSSQESVTVRDALDQSAVHRLTGAGSAYREQSRAALKRALEYGQRLLSLDGPEAA